MAALVVATIGVHGSASTWVFNVARELLIEAFGESEVSAGYAETVAGLPAAAARMVIKSHHGSAALDEWLAQARAKILLSVRDPRDAAVSMAQRFHAKLEQTVGGVLQDSSRAARLAGRADLLVRYEDGFFDDFSTVARIAAVLGVAVDEAAARRIFARYRTAEVRRFAAHLAELGPERLVRTAATTVDRVTNIHSTQIGDGRVGKWRDLAPGTQAELTRAFAGYLEFFGYRG